MQAKKIKKIIKYPKVGILVLNWNGKQDTLECLTSLKGIDYSNFEIIVVDNASTDGSQESFKSAFPEVTLVENLQNLGFTGGFNVGIQKAIERNSHYVLCLNNDTVVDRNFLKELVIVGEQSHDIGGLCPKEYDYFHPEKIVYAGGKIGLLRSKNYRYGETDNGQCEKVSTTEMLCGSAMMLKTEALLNIGFLDPDYFFDWEDKDIAIRLMKKGYSLTYVPTAKFWHKRRGSTKGSVAPLNVYFHFKNYLLFARKHYRKHEIAIVFFSLIIVHMPFAIIRSSNKRKCFKSIIKAIQWHIDRKPLPNDYRTVEMLK